MTRPLNRLHRQRGAATLLATVFLVISVSLMVVVVLNMAGSDITDTSMQSDAVEALFIAESGVEQASWLYANGTACIALVGTTDSVGRGDFTVTAAQLVGGNCRVRVQGTVSQTHAVQRTLDADLRLNSGGVFAVGDNGTILEWDGSAWNAVASGTGQNLNGIHCVNASDCRTVGENGTILHWDGSAWSSVNAGGNIDFPAVACTDDDSDNCYAPGSAFFIFFPLAVIQEWTGGPNWNNDSLIWFPGYTYAGIACSTNRCYVIADTGLVLYSDGIAWNDDTSGITEPLNGISCTSDDICWAVGNRLTGPNAYAIYGRNAFGNWFSDSIPNNPSRDLHDIDCFAPNQCWAVGEQRSGNAYTFAYRNGANWAVDSPALGSAQDLNGVSCSSSGECWAVGDNGSTLYWDGTAWDGSGWTVVPSGTGQNLNDVFFLGSGGAGAVSLVRWEEVVQ